MRQTANTVLLIAAAIMTACSVTAHAATYTHDELGRLKAVTYSSGKTVTYSYDAAGNILTTNLTAPVTPSAGTGGSMTPATVQTVSNNATTSFTVTPSAGYSIAGITGCNGTLNGSIYTTGAIAGACTVNATFKLNSYIVTFVFGGHGSLTGITSQTVNNAGNTSAVTAMPATGYHFVNWTGTGGFTTTTNNPLTLSNVTATQTITANFAIGVPNGTCGSSNGGTFTVVPATNLCLSGTASTVSGTGPWSWTCTESNYGSPASCLAGKATAQDTTAPTLTLSTLANNATTNYATLNVAGTVSDSGSGVKSMTVNGQSVTITNGTFTIAITLVNGSNTVTTIATDNADNTTTDTRTITLDRTAPGLNITQPADNSVTNKPFAEIIGSVDDPNATVTAKVNGSSATTATMSGTNYSVTLNLTSGMNTIDITATNQAGNTSTSKRTVIYNNSAPSLTVSNPSQDITAANNSVSIGGAVTDTITSATIRITADGQSYTPAIESSGSFNQVINLPAEKTYTVVVTATDQSGNTAAVQRNIIKITALTQPTISDALKALQAVVGISPLTTTEQIRYDVAPLSAYGKPLGNGVIDAADVILILRRSIGIGSW